MKSMEQKEKFIELRAQGKSFNAIATELSMSKSTLIDWSRELEIEISNLKAIELEALQEQYFIAKKQRIELFGEQVKNIKAELETRELKDVPTDKLYGIFFKLLEVLNEEAAPVLFTQEVDEGRRIIETSGRGVIKWKA